jgi:hypothetical protein
MNKPDFIRAEVFETITLADPRPGWRGVPSAELTLGRFADGRWTYAASAHADDGGFGGPLGYWTDARSILAFDSREAALEAGAQHIADRMKSRHVAPTPAVNRIVTWAKGLLSFQGDLFAFAA